MTTQQQIEGLFEVHLIVRVGDQARLFAFYNDHSTQWIRPRPTCAQAFYGLYPTQPMLTLWLRGTDKSVLKEAGGIMSLMEKEGMNVIRLKVEAMPGSTGVPESVQDYQYYEFHFKVAIGHSREWHKLAKICAQYGAHLFFNSYSQTCRFKPVVTLRRYDSTFEDAEKALNDLRDDISNHPEFIMSSGIDKEYSVLDSNVLLDDGWLFSNGEPKRFITEI